MLSDHLHARSIGRRYAARNTCLTALRKAMRTLLSLAQITHDVLVVMICSKSSHEDPDLRLEVHRSHVIHKRISLRVFPLRITDINGVVFGLIP